MDVLLQPDDRVEQNGFKGSASLNLLLDTESPHAQFESVLSLL